MTLLYSNIKVTDISHLHGPIRAVQLMRTPILKTANTMQTAFEVMYPALNFQIYFSKKEESQHPNRFFTSDGSRVMLEGKTYCSLYIDFPFVAQFLDRCIEMP